MVISEIVNKTTSTAAQHRTATKLNCWQLQHTTLNAQPTIESISDDNNNILYTDRVESQQQDEKRNDTHLRFTRHSFIHFAIALCVRV